MTKSALEDTSPESKPNLADGNEGLVVKNRNKYAASSRSVSAGQKKQQKKQKNTTWPRTGSSLLTLTRNAKGVPGRLHGIIHRKYPAYNFLYDLHPGSSTSNLY